MTTATVHTPPTEAEIRASIASLPGEWDDAWTGLAAPIEELYNVADLRASELERLDQLMAEAYRELKEWATREVTERLVAAALVFAAEHPDAPRAIVGSPS